MDIYTRITREKVLEAKEQLDDEDREIFEKYLNELASYSKVEADEKKLTVREKQKLKHDIVGQAFPEKEVDLMDIRRAIRREIHRDRIL